MSDPTSPQPAPQPEQPPQFEETGPTVPIPPAPGYAQQPSYGAPQGAPQSPYGAGAQPPYGSPAQPPYSAAPNPYGAPAQPPYGSAQPTYGEQPYGASQNPYATSPASAPSAWPSADPYAAPYGGYGAAATKTNVLAIVSLIASLSAFVILPFIGSVGGVITGHLALSQIKRTAEGGRGMALAGVIIGWVSLGLVLLGILLFFALIIPLAASSHYSYS